MILWMKLVQVEIWIAKQGIEHADCEELMSELIYIRQGFRLLGLDNHFIGKIVEELAQLVVGV